MACLRRERAFGTPRKINQYTDSKKICFWLSTIHGLGLLIYCANHIRLCLEGNVVISKVISAAYILEDQNPLSPPPCSATKGKQRLLLSFEWVCNTNCDNFALPAAAADDRAKCLFKLWCRVMQIVVFGRWRRIGCLPRHDRADVQQQMTDQKGTTLWPEWRPQRWES